MFEKGKKFRVSRFWVIYCLIPLFCNVAQAQKKSGVIMPPIINSESLVRYPHPGTLWLLEPLIRLKKRKKIKFESDDLDALRERLGVEEGKTKRKLMKKAAAMAVKGALVAENKDQRAELLGVASTILTEKIAAKKIKKTNAEDNIKIQIINWLKDGTSPDTQLTKKWMSLSSSKWKRRGRFFISLAKLGTDESKSARSMILKTAKKSKAYDSVIFMISAGTILSGFNFQGDEISSPNPVIGGWSKLTRKYLGTLGKTSKFFNRDQLLVWSFENWRKGKGKGIFKIGFKPKEFSGIYGAISELKALKYIKLGKIVPAVSVYQKMADGFKSSKDEESLSLVEARIIELIALYPPSQVFALEFKKVEKRHEGESLKKVIKLWIPLVFDIQKKAQNDPAMLKLVNKGSIFWFNKVSKLLDSTDIKSVAMVLSSSLAKAGKMSQAVMVLGRLFKFPEHLVEAAKESIKYQAKIAEWPTEPNFEGVRRKLVPERKKLYRLYLLLSSKDKEVDWNNEAHKGLLYMTTEGIAKGAGSWLSLLFKHWSGQEQGQKMAGFLARTLDPVKNTNFYVILGHIVKRKKMEPISRGRKIDWKKGFGTALYLSGTAKFKIKKYKQAAPFLSEFEKDYLRDKRREEVLFLLGQSYVNLGTNDQAVDVLLAMTKGYPKGKYFYQGLLYGGDVAEKAKREKEFAEFFELFNVRFPNDIKAPEIRGRLITYYLSKQFYGEALKLLKEQSLNKKVSVAVQLESALQYMRVEEKFGERNRAQFGVRRILSMPQAQEKHKAIAYGLMARLAADQDELSVLTDIEKKLSSWNQGTPEVQDTLSYVRFIIARENLVLTYSEIDVLKLRKPALVIENYVREWQSKTKDLMKVCVNGAGNFCAPSLLRIWQVSQLALSAIEQITIPSSLSEEEVNYFNNRKKALIRPIEQFAESSLDRAVTLSEKGRTPIEWKELIEGVEEEEFRPEGLPETVDFTLNY